MKNKLKLSILLFLFTILFTNCEKAEKYPKYSICEIEFVPDSLKKEHRKFIIETVRAGSQNMTGGDYEDVDETIQQAEITADRVFSIKELGLKKVLYDGEWNPLQIKQSEFNSYEKVLFDSLSTVK